jgi:hypothetical protein
MKDKIVGKAPRKPRRAVELFSAQFNFQPKIVPNKRAYTRKVKHQSRELD